MLIYILKSSMCLGIFQLFYKLFLENENMHIFKRFYLLGAALTSLIIPLVIFTEYVEVEVGAISQNTIHTIQELPFESAMIPETSTNYLPMILWSLYVVGILIFGYYFLKNLFEIFKRIQKNPKLKTHNTIKVLLCEPTIPHTFFNYIFLNQQKFEAKEIPDAVLLHEETHAKQKHSIDVFLVEFLQVLFWFNPLIIGLKKAIKLNHEFLADQAVVTTGIPTNTYQSLILAYSSNAFSPKLANSINYSSIKKRISVMKTKTSKKSVAIRSLLLLPLFAMLLFSFSKKKEVLNKITTAKTNISTNETENPKLINFEILVINTEKGVKLNCLNGCAWRELEFNLAVEQKQFLDKYGMVSSLDKNPEKALNSSNFLISLQKTNGDLVFRGFSGTAWTDLRFSHLKRNAQKIDQWGMTTSIQNGATKKQILEYNALSKKHNAVPIEKRIIPLKDLKVLETIYREMTLKQRQESLPFPECPVSSNQEPATKKQLTEYNTLAKKYNAMIQKGKIWIEESEVKRMTSIYNLMTDAQKEKALPFPDFPPPPPAPQVSKAPKAHKAEKSLKAEKALKVPKEAKMPKAPKVEKGVKSDMPLPAAPAPATPKPPKNVSDVEYASNQIENIIEQQDPYDVGPINQLFKQPNQLIAPTYVKEIQPISPSPEPPEATKSLKEATIYLNGKEITYEKMKKMEEEGTIISMRITKGKINRIDLNEAGFEPPIPQAPPKPQSPLDHVVEMAKKGATFYYEGKEISSDKAIELLKKNKNINIDSRSPKGEKPVVKLSTEPITIEN